MTNNNVPKLRFSEFSDGWEVKKLGDIILKLSSGVSVNSIDEPIRETDEYGILKTSCISSGKFYPTQNKKIVPNEVSKAKLNPLADTILISRMNTPQLVGESGYIDSDYPNLFIPDRLWMTEIGIQNNAKFLSILLSSSNMMEKISNIATGTSGSMKNISKPNFLDIECTSPTLPEQHKIATFLSTVDEKLQALKKKKSLLETYKKGVMQKLFSQEIRFKDDKGNDFEDWEVKTLGEDLKIQGGFAFKSENFNEGYNTKVFRIGDILPYINTQNFTGVYSSELPNDKYIVRKDDFLMALSGATFGKVGKIIDDGIGYINQRVATFRTKKCLEFYYQLVQTDNFKNYINSIPTASAQPNISNDDIGSYTTAIPSLPEQTKIANFLTAIDEKITKVDAQIKQTELWKKGLLQGMFC